MTLKKLVKLIQTEADFEKIIIKPILENSYNTTLREISDEDLKEVMEAYIVDKFFSFLKGCIYIFDKEEFVLKRADFTTEDEYRFSNSFRIQTSIEIKGFSRVIDVFIKDHGVSIEGADELSSFNNGEWNVEIDIANFNKYTGNVLVNGIFKGSDYNHIVFDNDYTIKFSVEGLKNNATHPIWTEPLIDGYLELESGNEKNAFLNLFASTDYLINYLHELVFEYYLKQVSPKKINNDLKEKIRLFSNKRQRLQNKLINVGEALDINIKQMDCYKKWLEFTNIRDGIAHGGKFKCPYDLKDVLINIITLIMTLLSGTNIEEKGWRGAVR